MVSETVILGVWLFLHHPSVRRRCFSRSPGQVSLLRRPVLLRRDLPDLGAHAPPTGSQPAAATRISTVSCPAPSTTPLTAPLRSSPGSSAFVPLLFGAAANISSLFVGFGSVCGIPSAWIDAVRASPCEVSPNRAMSPGLRSSRHGAPKPSVQTQLVLDRMDARF